MRSTILSLAASLAAIGLFSIGSLAVGQNAENSTPPAVPQNASENAFEELGPEINTSGSVDVQQDANPDSAAQPERNQDENASDSATQSNDSPDEGATEDNAKQSESSDSQNDDQQSSDADKDKDTDKDKQAKSDTPEVPEQARQADQLGEVDRNADWRTSRYNNQWWYYAPSGQWNYYRNGQWQTYNADSYQRPHSDEQYAGNSVVQGEPYSTAYRGEPMPQSTNNSYDEAAYYETAQQASQLRYDRCGRPYVCQNGRAVYVTVESGSSRPVGDVWGGETVQYQQDTGTSGVNGMSAEQGTTIPSPPQPRDSSFEPGRTGDDVGRPTPAREDLRSIPPAPPEATP